MFEERNIILSSGSPRRKQLLEQAEIHFRVKKTNVAEGFPVDMNPDEVPAFLAVKKATAAKEYCTDNELVLTADTVVISGEKILGKPQNEEEAIQNLTSLSGGIHRVVTGVCLMQGDRKRIFSEQTKVYFRMLSEEQIKHYIYQYKPMDKAGAYAIQEWIGLISVKRIEGDYFNVVGLPVGRLIEEIALF